MKVNKALGFVAVLAFSATLMCASAYAATYSIGALQDSTGVVEGESGADVTVPVVVTPDANETEQVNGYVMTLTYDPTLAEPNVANAEGDSVYATVGDALAGADGILVSDVISTSANEETLVVAWAAAQPVDVTTATTLATVEFNVKAAEGTNVPVAVAVTQLSNDGTLAETGTYTVASGEIDLGEAVDIEWGNVDGSHDAEGNPTITPADAGLILEYLAELTDLTEEQITVANVDLSSDASGNATLTPADAGYILEYLAELRDTLPVQN